MNPEKKLFLLDGMALVYRAHFALSKNPRFTSTGLNTSAILGFTNTLLEILHKERPSHIAVVFDTEAATERHTDFIDYKAHRQEMPEDLSIALPIIKKIIRGFSIPSIESDGYEADDIIGTLAKKAEQEGFTIFCMTPDKDFAQLVSENIFLYKPSYMGNEVVIYGVTEVLNNWEIERVEQVIDILGLWGDAVDNIPGIPGIGEKTAKTLIKQYGSVENIIAHASELKGKMRENVEKFAGQGLLSKKLATILLDAPVSFIAEDFRVKPPDAESLHPLLIELEFRSMVKRIFGEQGTIRGERPVGSEEMVAVQGNLFAQAPHEMREEVFETDKIEGNEVSFRNAKDTQHVYKTVKSLEEVTALASLLQTCKEISVDTETTSTDPNDSELVGVSFSVKPGEGYYFPYREEDGTARQALLAFKRVLEDPRIVKVGQNLKFDIIILKWYGIEVQGALFDTMIAHYIMDADSRHNMDILSENYLKYSPIPITDLIGKKRKTQGSMKDVDLETITEYAAEDADIALQLKHAFTPLLEAVNGTDLVVNMESPLIYVLADMEREGVKVDEEALKLFSNSLEEDIKVLENSICKQAGCEFNIASPKQLGEVLFEKMQLDPKAKKTKTGQYQTGEDVLASLSIQHDIAKNILDYRSLQKLKSTYVDALPTMVNKKTGRIHTSYNQAVAATGRLSSNNPNLQNIPIRTERGREVRRAFVPRDADHRIISADYSQIELRVIAEISRDPGMLEAFQNNIDIHTATAAKVYHVPIESVDSTMRRNAKSVNFGIIYGQSAFGLSQNLGIPRSEASAIIAEYFKQYPNIQKYMRTTIDFARKHGYVETIMKRRRYLRDINSVNQTVRGYAERNAINAPIQGSAADMIKIAMIDIFKDFNDRHLKSKMTMQVHDELVFDVPADEVEVVKPIVLDRMKNAFQMDVPVVVEIGVGQNWLEAH